LLQEATLKRKQLLPIWIRLFCWFFLLTGLIAPLLVIVGLFTEINASLALYGMETHNPISTAGLLISTLFLLKGIVAYGLCWEKDWAVELGIIDAIVGIAFCALMMTPIATWLELAPQGLRLRLELVALIPYLMKLQKIKPLWRKGGSNSYL